VREGKRRQSVEEISDMLSGIAKSCGRLFIVIDALDECLEKVQIELLRTISKMLKHPGVSFMATSRPHGNIEEQFKSGFPNYKKLEIRASNEDVEKYLLQRMSQSQQLVLRNLTLQEDIKVGIIKAVNGMYVSSYPSRLDQTNNINLGSSSQCFIWIHLSVNLQSRTSDWP
jgi:hypothetical protein